MENKKLLLKDHPKYETGKIVKKTEHFNNKMLDWKDCNFVIINTI